MPKACFFIWGTCLLALTGCTTCIDPLEPVNRQIFTFNRVLDRGIFRPVAKAYDTVVPAVIHCSIGNFFDNIDDLTNIANNALQFKLRDAWSDCWRFALNTTVGIGGLFDVASCAGLPKHHQDFGLTLARYGFVRSTYLMIPFFGPSTIRDSISWAVDWRYLSIWPYIQPKSLRYGLYGLRLIHKRAELLDADQLIDDALDPYIFVRDAYLQKRESDIKNIHPLINQCMDYTQAGTGDNKDTEDTFVAAEDTVVDSKKESEEPATKMKNSSDDPFVAP